MAQNDSPGCTIRHLKLVINGEVYWKSVSYAAGGASNRQRRVRWRLTTSSTAAQTRRCCEYRQPDQRAHADDALARKVAPRDQQWDE